MTNEDDRDQWLEYEVEATVVFNMLARSPDAARALASLAMGELLDTPWVETERYEQVTDAEAINGGRYYYKQTRVSIAGPESRKGSQYTPRGIG